jgi:hypothetical protein
LKRVRFNTIGEDMSVAEIKREIKVLPDQERRDLIAYLVHLEQARDDGYLKEMTDRIDDREKFERSK